MKLQSRAIQELIAEQANLNHEIQIINQQIVEGSQLLESFQQGVCSMSVINRRLANTQNELVTAREKQLEIIRRYRAQRVRCTSWENLLDREVSRFRAENSRREMRLADETYLLTKFLGEST
ncbi:MAG TPA: hypothetical protein PKD64_11820 [Pirellulaceae bacterium]|nr:hypothetical protein [Pirellulaceae bacterium]HMO92872.1 hypothetical protein [Pirellulaceae bacterium]HMP71095.1 hypothetical protein [Pirellulaceae bacterium]